MFTSTLVLLIIMLYIDLPTRSSLCTIALKQFQNLAPLYLLELFDLHTQMAKTKSLFKMRLLYQKRKSLNNTRYHLNKIIQTQSNPKRKKSKCNGISEESIGNRRLEILVS